MLDVFSHKYDIIMLVCSQYAGTIRGELQLFRPLLIQVGCGNL